MPQAHPIAQVGSWLAHPPRQPGQTLRDDRHGLNYLKIPLDITSYNRYYVNYKIGLAPGLLRLPPGSSSRQFSPLKSCVHPQFWKRR